MISDRFVIRSPSQVKPIMMGGTSFTGIAAAFGKVLVVEGHEVEPLFFVDAAGGVVDAFDSDDFVGDTELVEVFGELEVVFVIEAFGADPEEDGEVGFVLAFGEFFCEVPGVVSDGEEAGGIGFPAVVFLDAFFRFVSGAAGGGGAEEFGVFEHDACGPAAALGESFDGAAFGRAPGAIGFVDVGDEFVHEDVFTEAVFFFGKVIPGHGAAIGEDVDRGLDVAIGDGMVDEFGELDGFGFGAGAAAVEVVNDGEFLVLLGFVFRREINEVADVEGHGGGIERGVFEGGREFFEFALLVGERIGPGEGGRGFFLLLFIGLLGRREGG